MKFSLPSNEKNETKNSKSNKSVSKNFAEELHNILSTPIAGTSVPEIEGLDATDIALLKFYNDQRSALGEDQFTALLHKTIEAMYKAQSPLLQKLLHFLDEMDILNFADLPTKLQAIKKDVEGTSAIAEVISNELFEEGDFSVEAASFSDISSQGAPDDPLANSASTDTSIETGMHDAVPNLQGLNALDTVMQEVQAFQIENFINQVQQIYAEEVPAGMVLPALNPRKLLSVHIKLITFFAEQKELLGEQLYAKCLAAALPVMQYAGNPHAINFAELLTTLGFKAIAQPWQDKEKQQDKDFSALYASTIELIVDKIMVKDTHESLATFTELAHALIKTKENAVFKARGGRAENLLKELLYKDLEYLHKIRPDMAQDLALFLVHNKFLTAEDLKNVFGEVPMARRLINILNTDKSTKQMTEDVWKLYSKYQLNDSDADPDLINRFSAVLQQYPDKIDKKLFLVKILNENPKLLQRYAANKSNPSAIGAFISGLFFVPGKNTIQDNIFEPERFLSWLFSKEAKGITLGNKLIILKQLLQDKIISYQQIMPYVKQLGSEDSFVKAGAYQEYIAEIKQLTKNTDNLLLAFLSAPSESAIQLLLTQKEDYLANAHALMQALVKIIPATGQNAVDRIEEVKALQKSVVKLSLIGEMPRKQSAKDFIKKVEEIDRADFTKISGQNPIDIKVQLIAKHAQLQTLTEPKRAENYLRMVVKWAQERNHATQAPQVAISTLYQLLVNNQGNRVIQESSPAILKQKQELWTALKERANLTIEERFAILHIFDATLSKKLNGYDQFLQESLKTPGFAEYVETIDNDKSQKFSISQKALAMRLHDPLANLFKACKNEFINLHPLDVDRFIQQILEYPYVSGEEKYKSLTALITDPEITALPEFDVMLTEIGAAYLNAIGYLFESGEINETQLKAAICNKEGKEILGFGSGCTELLENLAQLVLYNNNFTASAIELGQQLFMAAYKNESDLNKEPRVQALVQTNMSKEQKAAIISLWLDRGEIVQTELENYKIYLLKEIANLNQQLDGLLLQKLQGQLTEGHEALLDDLLQKAEELNSHLQEISSFLKLKVEDDANDIGIEVNAKNIDQILGSSIELDELNSKLKLVAAWEVPKKAPATKQLLMACLQIMQEKFSSVGAFLPAQIKAITIVQHISGQKIKNTQSAQMYLEQVVLPLANNNDVDIHMIYNLLFDNQGEPIIQVKFNKDMLAQYSRLLTTLVATQSEPFKNKNFLHMVSSLGNLLNAANAKPLAKAQLIWQLYNSNQGKASEVNTIFADILQKCHKELDKQWILERIADEQPGLLKQLEKQEGVFAKLFFTDSKKVSYWQEVIRRASSLIPEAPEKIEVVHPNETIATIIEVLIKVQSQLEEKNINNVQLPQLRAELSQVLKLHGVAQISEIKPELTQLLEKHTDRCLLRVIGAKMDNTEKTEWIFLFVQNNLLADKHKPFLSRFLKNIDANVLKQHMPEWHKPEHPHTNASNKIMAELLQQSHEQSPYAWHVSNPHKEEESRNAIDKEVKLPNKHSSLGSTF